MRLASLSHCLPPDLLISLETCGIKTVANLLFSPPADIFLRLPQGAVTLSALQRYISRVAEAASAPANVGNELLMTDGQRNEGIHLHTGIPPLDALLDGFGGKRIIEFAGDRGSGKTTLALNIILHHLANHSEGIVAWIDTAGKFAAGPVNQILGSYSSEPCSTVLDRLHISVAFEVGDVQNLLEELNFSRSSSLGHTLICIVIDTITPLLAPLLSSASSQGHAIMTDFMRQLRTFSRMHSIPILILNDTAAVDASSTRNRKPALGPTFTFLSDATLWLSVDGRAQDEENATIHSARVLRSRTTGMRSCNFRVCSGVIAGA